MPHPYVADCQDSMNEMAPKVSQIRFALETLESYTDANTWSGKAADKWRAELTVLLKAAKACLDHEIPEAKKACFKEAQRMQRESATGG